MKQHLRHYGLGAIDMNNAKRTKTGETQIVGRGREVVGDYKKTNPAEKYSQTMKEIKKKNKFIVVFFLIELVICSFFIINFNTYDLPYRVTREIENSLTGKNRFFTGSYTGDTDFGYFFGDGIFEYNTGTVYIGNWNDNYMQGKGSLNTPNEGVYEGEFKNSKKNGRGSFEWTDGTVYSGNWEDDQMDGQGIYISFDGTEYSGIFEDNRLKTGTCDFENETGTYHIKYENFVIDNVDITFSDGTTYTGDSAADFLSGIGIMNFANGDQYTGKYSSGLRNEQGVYTWHNGDVYDGIWKNDTMSGNGVYTYANGNCAQGVFENNVFVDGSYTVKNSFGEYVFKIKEGDPIQVEMKLSSGTTYSGGIRGGKLTGTAQIVYSNGDSYSGVVSDGKKNGQGIYKWRSGASYEGDWKEDKMSGKGTYYYPTNAKGYKLVGDFKEGVPDGECQYYVTSTEQYKTDWSKGKCIKVYQ